MAAITISRQLGSHGGRIARALSRELGWEFTDKATINRVVRQYGLVRLDEIYSDTPPRLREYFDANSQVTIEMMNQTIAAIAARGNVVILGRGGFAVMQGFADVLNVFVGAPAEKRIERLARRDDIDEAEAEVKVKDDEKTRRRFTRMYYGADWADPENFDLVVDTGSVSDTAAVAQIRAAVAALPAADVDADAKLTTNLVVDPVLAKTVAEVMETPRGR
jgi:cytidylate kinase